MINKTGQAAKNILIGHSNIIMVIKGLLVAYLFTIPMYAIFEYFL
ncbi:MAG: TIGR04086 family membrane protein, partial [Hungateiclostridium thermocellum]|nr:TIGR04086 family membrane protein [Acetivibrio thermocellus]